MDEIRDSKNKRSKHVSSHDRKTASGCHLIAMVKCIAQQNGDRSSLSLDVAAGCGRFVTVSQEILQRGNFAASGIIS